MSVESDLEIWFQSPLAKQLPAYKCLAIGIELTGETIAVRIESAEQVADAFALIVGAGIKPNGLSIRTRTDDARLIDEGHLIGVIPDPEDVVDLDRDASAREGCRVFVPDSQPLRLLCPPPKSLRFGFGTAGRPVVNAELAEYSRDASDAEPKAVWIDGQVSDQWYSLDFKRTHDIIHGPKVFTTSNCRWCGALQIEEPACWIGRDHEWTDPLYCDSTGWGHDRSERPLIVPIAHLDDFDRWTGRKAAFRPVFSDSTGPGKIALETVASFDAF